MLKSLSLAGAVAGALLITPAFAAPITADVARDVARAARTLSVNWDDDDRIEKLQKDLEKALGEFLEWEPTQKRFRLKEDMARTLPVPPPMVEGFINRMLKEEDGKPVFKSKDQFKQALPLLRRFLAQGEDRIKGLPNLSPEERERLLKQARGFGKLFEEPKKPAKKSAKGLERLKKLAPKRLRPNKALLERLERLEKRIDELEKELEGKSGPRNPLGKNPLGGKAVPEALGTAKDFAGALSRLNKIMTKEDKELLMRNGLKLGRAIKPSDLQNQRELMRKLQSNLEPGDLPRLMEIMSEFLETKEGQNMEARAEKMIGAFENFVQSEQGKRVMERLQNLGRSGGKGVPKGLKKLFGERKRGKRALY